MKEKLKNKKVVYTIIGIVSVLLVALAVTYAYWLVTKTQTGENEITAACLDITISGEKNDIELTNQFPMSDEDGMKLVPYEFTVTNNCNTSVDYQVALEATGTESNAMATSSIKAGLNDDVMLLSNRAELATTISGAYESRTIGYGTLAASGNEGSSATYKLRIWIDEEAPISEMNKMFTSKISVTIGQGIFNPYKEGTLAYSIFSNYGGVDTISEIDENEYNHRTVSTKGTNLGTNSIWFGTDYTFDETTKIYKLSGTLIQATLEECRNGTKICGKYTLMNTSSTYESATLYEVTNWNPYNNAFVLANKIKYVKPFAGGTVYGEYGLYSTEDDYGISYYFRGDVTNNYVQFGNFSSIYSQYNGPFETMEECEKDEYYKINYCFQDSDGKYKDDFMWNSYDTLEECEAGIKLICEESLTPMYWRIVRINGNGTIRLLYDGTSKFENGKQHHASIGTAAYNDKGNDIKYVGYTYDDGTGTQVDSEIKSVVDTWYDKYLEPKYGDKISDVIFCNDRSYTATYYDEDGNEITDPNAAVYTNIYYGAYQRLKIDKSPSLKCINKSDRYTVNDIANGNGLLTNPIGLLTADELVFAGTWPESSTEVTYLDNQFLFRTMSPGTGTYNSAQIWWYNGSLNYYGYITSKEDVRPVINLKADVKFTGNGTIDNPYKIVTE